jgi:Ca-activated chloride channel family protein
MTMVFARPVWLWALLALPLLVWLDHRARTADRRRLDAFLSPSMLERLASVSSRRSLLTRRALVAAGFALLTAGLARPQWGAVRERIEREGADVAFVFDTSLSMSVEDAPPNRFFLARQSAQSLMSQLPGDRFALVAFEGEAFALAPLTLDADAVALFLETMEPGFVPTPGSNLRAGVERGVAALLDPSRQNRILVVVSDGEDLSSGIDDAIAAARQAGVVVHAIGVGTAEGGPVPDIGESGERAGYKMENGRPVVSRFNPNDLRRLAQATGGVFWTASPADTTAAPVAQAIAASANKGALQEFAFRRGERFQIPLLAAYALLLLGLHGRTLRHLALSASQRVRRLARGSAPSPVGAPVAALAVALFLAPAPLAADVIDELLGRPARSTSVARKAYESGDLENAARSFSEARASRPADPRTRFNEATTLLQRPGDGARAATETLLALARDPKAGLAFESHYNLGTAALARNDAPSAVSALRDALRIRPDDARARRNLEIALRELEKQKQQKKERDEGGQDDQPKDQPQPQPSPSPRNPEEQKRQEEQRFREKAGMPKQQAMQLLTALEEKEKAEQKRRLEAERRKRKAGRDW